MHQEMDPQGLMHLCLRMTSSVSQMDHLNMQPGDRLYFLRSLEQSQDGSAIGVSMQCYQQGWYNCVPVTKIYRPVNACKTKGEQIAWAC